MGYQLQFRCRAKGTVRSMPAVRLMQVDAERSALRGPLCANDGACETQDGSAPEEAGLVCVTGTGCIQYDRAWIKLCICDQKQGAWPIASCTRTPLAD